MRPARWLAACLKVLLLVTLVTTGAHTHAHDAPDHPCAVCAIGHAPAVTAPDAPAVAAPELTFEVVALTTESVQPAPSCAIPASRAPPLG